MLYKLVYKTPEEFDDILITSDGIYLTGLEFITDKEPFIQDFIDIEVFKETCKWLDIYFTGREPNFTPKYKINNSTKFRCDVLKILKTIPYGSTITYKDIANTIKKNNNISKMSCQAVGGAVKRNPIGIIIPCHRVIGTNNSLIGYRGGMKNKIALLALEQNDMSKFIKIMPKNQKK